MTTAGSIRAVRLTAIILCAFGAIVLAYEFFRFLVVFPWPAVLAVLLELPPLLIGMALLRVLRPVHAPALIWSAAAIIWGASAAAGCALLANQGLIGLWAKGAGTHFAANWSASLSAPLNEELLKLCGVIMIVLAAPLVVNGPIDGMVFGALTGLGFQVIENVTYGLNSIVLTGGTDPDRAVLNSMLVRVGVTGLGSHWTMTAVAGAGAGFLLARVRGRERGSMLAAVACLLTAMGMHLLFDAPQPAIEIKVIVNLAIVTSLYLLLSHGYRRRVEGALAGQAAAGVLTDAEAAGLLHRRDRRRELRQAADRAGLEARQREILARIDLEAV